MKIGDRVQRVPETFGETEEIRDRNRKRKARKRAYDGTVIYIHPLGRFHVVAFETRGGHHPGELRGRMRRWEVEQLFRYKRGVKADYNRQGYIYFTSRRYRELDEAAQQKILNLCLEHGGEYYQALFEFVTTDASATALAMRHHMDKTTLYRKVRKYYENFPTQL